MDKKKTWKPSASTIIATIIGLLGVVINDEHQTTVDYCSLAARACTEVGLSRVWVCTGLGLNSMENDQKYTFAKVYWRIEHTSTEYHNGFFWFYFLKKKSSIFLSRKKNI